MSTRSAPGTASRRITPDRQIVLGVEVVRAGHVEPFLNIRPRLLSDTARWGGITLESYSVPAVVIPRHEHPEHFLHLVLDGSVVYEVKTGGRTLQYTSHPGTTFLLPRGTVDEITWRGPTKRLAAAIRPELLTNALEETEHETYIDLPEHWDLKDRHITALLLECRRTLMTALRRDGFTANHWLMPWQFTCSNVTPFGIGLLHPTEAEYLAFASNGFLSI
jgi:AraC family transcriptional regulator